MKKLLSHFLIAVLCLGLYAESGFCADSNINTQKQHHEKIRKDFEQRLNLSDKQKAKAKAIHQKGRKQMQPIISKIKTDKINIEKIKQSKLSEKNKQEKIEELNNDIKNLQKQAAEIRKKNSEEFEKILNKRQKEELAKMKAEGRMRFEKNHPPRAPFAGLGTPNFKMQQR